MGRTDENEIHADVVFMGGAKVGKTALVHRLLRVEPSQALEGRYKPTIEDSYIREFLVGDKSCRLRVVDTAGGYTFPAMQRLWAKRASAFVLVCCRDQEDSIEHMRNIMSYIEEERREKLRDTLLVIVVNKCDMHMKDWAVSDDAVELVAQDYQIPLSSIVYTSAFADMDVEQVLKCLWKQNEESKNQSIHFELSSEKNKIDRRSSAFAVLFGIHSKTPNKTTQPLQQTGRPYASSFSGPVLPRTKRLSSVPKESPGWLTKTFGKINLGVNSRPKVKRDSLSTVIDMQCNVS